DLEPAQAKLCAEHFATRLGARHRYVFLRNPRRESVSIDPSSEAEPIELGPWETQIRVYERATGTLVGVSPPLLPARARPAPVLPPALPRLERWRLSDASPQLGPRYDDSSWPALRQSALATGAADLDALGLHWGFAWLRGRFYGALDRLLLDARHCWAVWINGALVRAGDQLRYPLGVGADGARAPRVSLRRAPIGPAGENTIAILVESLGHNKAFADDGANPRGVVALDTGATRVRWRYRGGLV